MSGSRVSLMLLATFLTGLALGALVGAAAEHTTLSSVSTTPAQQPTSRRIDWCWIDSHPCDFCASDAGPLEPSPLLWALLGHHPIDRRANDSKVIDTGASEAEMVAKAKSVGCPLHEPPSW